MNEDHWATLWSYRSILYLFLIGIGAYLLAETSNLFMDAYLQSRMTVPEGVSPRFHKRPNNGRIRSADYQAIITQNIFDPTLGIVVPIPPAPVRFEPTPVMPVPVPPPPPPPPVVVVPPKVPLNVRLIGTVVRAEDPSYAVIQDNRSGRQLIYRVGDFIRDDAKVIRIERNRVIIARDDEEVILDYSGTSEGQKRTPAPQVQPVALPPPSPPALTPPSRGGIQNVAENRWMMDRREIDDAIAHLPELMTKARVVPNFTDGKPDGFRIFAIQEDSLYAKIGLQNGDVLQRVNNIDIRNPQNLLQVFERLKNERHIRIDLVRDSQEKSFDYIIR